MIGVITIKKFEIKFSKVTTVIGLVVLIIGLFNIYSSSVLLSDPSSFKASFEKTGEVLTEVRLNDILRFERISIVYTSIMAISSLLIIFKKKIGFYILAIATLAFTFYGLLGEDALLVLLLTSTSYVLLVVLIKENIFRRKKLEIDVDDKTNINN